MKIFICILTIIGFVSASDTSFTSVIDTSGYFIKKEYVAYVSDWEKKSYNTLQIKTYLLKSITPEKGSENVFPRVKIEEYTFQSEEDAAIRLLEFDKKPPKIRPYIEKTWHLRYAIQKVNKVYILSSDANRFQSHIEALYMISCKKNEDSKCQDSVNSKTCCIE